MSQQPILSRPELARAAAHFERACRASRMHSRCAQRALDRYGYHGPIISGIVQDHFPAHIKARLRTLARTVTRESDAAWQARPARVRIATMRALGSAIATRDGSGFYGPPRAAIGARGRLARCCGEED